MHAGLPQGGTRRETWPTETFRQVTEQLDCHGSKYRAFTVRASLVFALCSQCRACRGPPRRTVDLTGAGSHGSRHEAHQECCPSSQRPCPLRAHLSASRGVEQALAVNADERDLKASGSLPILHAEAAAPRAPSVPRRVVPSQRMHPRQPQRPLLTGAVDEDDGVVGRDDVVVA